MFLNAKSFLQPTKFYVLITGTSNAALASHSKDIMLPKEKEENQNFEIYKIDLWKSLFWLVIPGGGYIMLRESW